jgi:hypothetical protein
VIDLIAFGEYRDVVIGPNPWGALGDVVLSRRDLWLR